MFSLNIPIFLIFFSDSVLSYHFYNPNTQQIFQSPLKKLPTSYIQLRPARDIKYGRRSLRKRKYYFNSSLIEYSQCGLNTEKKEGRKNPSIIFLIAISRLCKLFVLQNVIEGYFLKFLLTLLVLLQIFLHFALQAYHS